MNRVAGSGAFLSKDEVYRYLLWRRVEPVNRKRCLFVMLNPSTADASLDDPTIRRCMNFARRLDCGWLDVVNLFAWRSRNPVELYGITAEEARGPENRWHVQQAASQAHTIVCGWGNHGGVHDQDLEVEQWLKGYTLHCFGTTVSGQPKHPLYLASNTPLQIYKRKS